MAKFSLHSFPICCMKLDFQGWFGSVTRFNTSNHQSLCVFITLYTRLFHKLPQTTREEYISHKMIQQLDSQFLMLASRGLCKDMWFTPKELQITLTIMNSALEVTNCRKHSKKFSSVGRIWASWGMEIAVNASENHRFGCTIKTSCIMLTSDNSIRPSLFMSNFCMNSFIFSLNWGFEGS